MCKITLFDVIIHLTYENMHNTEFQTETHTPFIIPFVIHVFEVMGKRLYKNV